MTTTDTTAAILAGTGADTGVGTTDTTIDIAVRVTIITGIWTAMTITVASSERKLGAPRREPRRLP